MMDDTHETLKQYASIVRLTSMPFNLISIFNSLGVLNIGIWGSYSLVFGIFLLLFGIYLDWVIN